MRIIALALKDLQQILKDRKSALFLVLMPILFTTFMGFAFGGSQKDSRTPVGLVNQDQGGVLSEPLQGWLEESDLVRPVLLDGKDEQQVDELVRDEELVAALIVPAGFSERALAGETIPPTVIAPSSPAGQAASTLLQSSVKRLLGAVQAARLSTEALDASHPFSDEVARRAYLDEALAAAIVAWQQPPLTVAVEAAGSQAIKPETPRGFVQSSPGMIVQFSVFSVITSAMVLVLERKSRTLQRLLTIPITPATVITGHTLAMFLVVFLEQVLLVAVGQFLFHVDYLREPLGTLLLMATLSLWVASLGLLIGAIAKVELQVVLASLIAMFVFTPLGGAWFPLEVAGKTFAAVAHLTPTAWAMEGFQNIVLRGLGLSSALLPAGILLVYTGVFLGLAVWRFRFE